MTIKCNINLSTNLAIYQ